MVPGYSAVATARSPAARHAATGASYHHRGVLCTVVFVQHIAVSILKQRSVRICFVYNLPASAMNEPDGIVMTIYRVPPLVDTIIGGRGRPWQAVTIFSTLL